MKQIGMILLLASCASVALAGDDEALRFDLIQTAATTGCDCDANCDCDADCDECECTENDDPEFAALLTPAAQVPPLAFTGLLVAGDPLHRPINPAAAAVEEMLCTELEGENTAPCPVDLAPEIAAGSKAKVKVKTQGYPGPPPVTIPDVGESPVRIEYLHVRSSQSSCSSGSCGTRAKRGWFRRR